MNRHGIMRAPCVRSDGRDAAPAGEDGHGEGRRRAGRGSGSGSCARKWPAEAAGVRKAEVLAERLIFTAPLTTSARDIRRRARFPQEDG